MALFMCMLVCVKCVLNKHIHVCVECVLYKHVCMCVYVYIHLAVHVQKPEEDVRRPALLILLYSLETGSLNESGTRVVDSQPQQSSCP